MAIHTLRIIKGGRTLLRKQVSEGLGRDAVVITAQAGVTYLFSDPLNNTGPNKISAKRVGKNLHVALGNGTPDVPDLIIEGYFDYPAAPLAGVLADGGQAAYDLGALAAPSVAPSDSTAADHAVAQASLPEGGWGKTGWALGIAGGALLLGATGGGGSGGNAPAADTAVTALAKVLAFAKDGSQAAPTTTDYTDAGVKGVGNANLAAINNAVDTLPVDSVDTKEELQAVVDAYNKILSEANSNATDATPGSNPQASDYAAIGANIGLAISNTTALALLNDVVANLATTAVDTVAEINAIAVVVDKVMNAAAGTPATLTLADYAVLGLPNTGSGAVTAVNLSAVNNAIASAGGQSKVDSYAELSALVTAVATIVSYADDTTQAVPTLAQYAAAGVTGVNVGNLDAINSAVDANAATGVDTKSELQAIVDAYNKILSEANGSAADATTGSNPVVSDYALIGANIGLAVANTAALSLLNGVIGSLATNAVDTVAEINALAVVTDKIIQTASGSPAALSLADYALLGLPTTGPGAVISVNLEAVNNAIALAGGPSKVDTYAELGNLVTAVATIVSYADDSTQAAPTLAHFTTIGITGVTVANLGAITSAVEANTAGGVDTQAELQALVDTYNLILAEANGTAADATPGLNPTAAQFALIGASIGAAATNTVNLSLLDDALAGLASTAVDTIAEINDLAAAANAVITGAGGNTAPTLAQLGTLGITGATLNNILAIQNAIAATADSGLQVDTMAELQAVVSAAANAATTGQTHIQNYAASNLSTAPTTADYTNIGVTGVDASNLGAINSAVDALSSTGVDTPYEVQTMVNAYNRILAEANGAAVDATPGVNPTANDYADIGANVGLASGGVASGSDLASSALSLLDDAIANMATTAVDTVAELNALGVTVDKIMNLAKLPTGTDISVGSLTMADLTLLGINTTLADTATEVDAILHAIIDSADTGSAVNTIQALQALVNAHAS
jgi:hypothetical protein